MRLILCVVLVLLSACVPLSGASVLLFNAGGATEQPGPIGDGKNIMPDETPAPGL